MKVIDLVVDTVVLTVSSFRTEWAGLESDVLRRVVVNLLWNPLQVVAEIMHLDIAFLEQVGGCRKVRQKLRYFDFVAFAQLQNRDTAKEDFVDMRHGVVRLVAQG